MFAVNDLPEHLEDEELLSTLGGVELADRRRYNPTLGLLLKLRSGLKRLIRRNRLHFNSPPLDYTESKVLFTMWEGVSAASAVDLGWGDAEALFHAGDVLSTKNLYLWSGLSKELNTHPLLPPAADGSIAFYKPFVDAVIAYQTSLERPVETFEDRESRDLAAAVKEHPRETCPVCCNRKHIYCGSCGGVRMPSTEHLLPPRIRLPFDVLLLVHW